MIAAIYARKSTEQPNADPEAKSVASQIAAARAFATAKGWTVRDPHIYADDAVSGAETLKLVNRRRLLDAAFSSAPPFRVLIMRDSSRFSRRDGEEAFAELKRLAQAGIEVHFYSDATRFAFGTFGDNVVGFVRAEMNAEYRRQVAKWVKEAMVRKANAGHVTGGRVFGYDNVRVNGHTERRINKPEAEVVRRIFALCAEGTGYTRIAKQLNAEGALTPKPRRGRPGGWSPSSVYEVLHRPLYRGEVIYNRTRRRDPDGTTSFAPRPESEWLRYDRPDLRIVAPGAWKAAHARLEGIRAHLLKVSGGRSGFHRRDIDSKYLLSGFTRCALCGGSIGALNRAHGHKTVYGCIAYHKRGTTVCSNGLRKPLALIDEAVLRKIHGDVLRPTAVRAIVDGLLKELAPATRARDVARNQQELRKLDAEIRNLTTAIAKGGQLPPLLEELTAKHARRQELTITIAAHEATDVRRIDAAAIERKVRQSLADWRDRLSGRDVDETRQALREILVGPLTLTPDGQTYRFEGELLVGRITGQVGLPTFRGHLRAHHKSWTFKFSGIAA